MSYIEALHGQHPVIIGSVIKSALDHSIVCELLQHPDCFPLPPGLVERCRGTKAHTMRGVGWNSAGLARGWGCCRGRTLVGAPAAPCCWDAPLRPEAINNQGYILKTKYREIYSFLAGKRQPALERHGRQRKLRGQTAGQSPRTEALLTVSEVLPPALFQDKA